MAFDHSVFEAYREGLHDAFDMLGARRDERVMVLMRAKQRELEEASAVRAGLAEVAGGDEQMYPCADCGTLRTKAEGGTVFTVCDACWDKHWKKTPEQALKRIEEDHSNCCGWPQKGDDCDVVKLARALVQILPAAYRAQSLCSCGETINFYNDWDEKDAKVYQRNIEKAERVLSEVAGGSHEEAG